MKKNKKLGSYKIILVLVYLLLCFPFFLIIKNFVKTPNYMVLLNVWEAVYVIPLFLYVMVIFAKKIYNFIFKKKNIYNKKYLTDIGWAIVNEYYILANVIGVIVMFSFIVIFSRMYIPYLVDSVDLVNNRYKSGKCIVIKYENWKPGEQVYCDIGKDTITLYGAGGVNNGDLVRIKYLKRVKVGYIECLVNSQNNNLGDK